MMKQTYLIIINCILFCCSAKAQTTDSVTNKFNAIPYVRTDTFAKFTGGDFNTYVENSVVYPLNQTEDIEGVIVVAYSVDVDGKVINARILKNLSPAIDQEILRVFNESPRWMAATFNGHNVIVNIGAKFNVSIKAREKQIHVWRVVPPRISEVTNYDGVFTAVQVPPTYPGGHKELVKYLDENIIYPPKALDNKVDAKVILSFVVEKDGSLSTFKVLRPVDEEFVNESIRVLKQCKFSPGVQSGINLRVEQAIVINFNHNHPSNHAER